MARTVKDTKLDRRAARDRLEPRKKPYWRAIDAGRHIGYYKGPRGGSWLARTGEAGRYQEKRLGAADDVRDANCHDVFSFAQAQAAARDWFDQLAREADALGSGEAVTVKAAVERYIETMNARLSKVEGRPVKARSASALGRHVLGNDELAATELHQLTVAQLRGWRGKLDVAPATRQRIANDLKAALNEAATSAALRLIIKDGLASPKNESHAPAEDAADASKLLTDDETRRLLKTIREADTDGDLYRMALLMAATGARFAQLRRLTVGDVQRDRKRIMVPASRKGRVGSAPRAAVPVPVGQDVLDELLPVTKSRKAKEPLLERWRHKQAGPVTWVRDSRGPWTSAAEMARPIRAAVKAAELGDAISAYSFRHSSIVRALKEGLPVRLVAQLHDTSIAIIERNYTRFMADALEELARKAIVPMVAPDRPENVVAIDARRQSG